jgi:predicted MPP superfamily phosphohydrolase
VTRRTLHLPNLPREWDGVTALHLTDFHLGPLVPGRYVRGVLERARTLSHDIAFFTGDFVSFSASYIDEMRDWLRGWPAPLGACAVLGNHDHYTDAAVITQALESIGIPVLSNRSIVAARAGAPIRIVGVDDPSTSRSDYRGAIRGVEPGAFRLLLAHSPDIVWSFGEREVDLVLCGHTHGGQVCLPGGQALICPVNLGTDFAQGVFMWRKATLFVNRGVGVVGFPLRTFCPPEIALLTLKRGSQP